MAQSKQGYDLSGEWKFIAKDDPSFAQANCDDSNWEKVQLPEKEKSVPVGCYRYHIKLPEVRGRERDYLGTEILIENIVGNSEVFFNGHSVGQTRGSGIYSYGRPQSYVIPPEAIQFGGENVIAIQVIALGGKESKGPIGITGSRIAMAPLGVSYLYSRMKKVEDKYSDLLRRYPNTDVGKMKGAEQIRNIAEMLRDAEENFARQRLAELNNQLKDIDSEIGKAEKIILKEYEDKILKAEQMAVLPKSTYTGEGSFGMLGRLYNDGLMVFNSNPAGFEYKYGLDAPYRVEYRGITPTRIYTTRMNWVSKTMRVEGKRDRDDVSYEVTHSSVFPGIMVKVNDDEFSFIYTNKHAKCPDYMAYLGEWGNIIVAPINPLMKKRMTKFSLNVDKVKVPMGRNWLVFWFTGQYGTQECYPLLVVLENDLNEFSMKEDENGETVMTLKAKGDIGHLVFVYPFGIQGIPSPNSNYLQANLPREFIETCNFWGYSSLQFPVGCEEKYYVNDSAKMVEIQDQYEYQVLDDTWGMGRITLAPIPPVLATAIKHGYPVKFPDQGTRSLPKEVEFNRIYPGLNFLSKTKFGEFGAFVGQSNVYFQLPIPPMENTDTVKREKIESQDKKEELKKLINESIKELCYPTAPNGVDRGYKGNTQAWMAYNYLDEKNKKRLWDSATTATLKTFDKDIWNLETEPFTHTPYPWTYFLEGPYYEKYDIDWGNGLPIYGFEKYAQYSGDWDAVRENWEQLKSINQYFDLADSWLWMSASNSDLGHGTGAGDCLCVTYTSALAMAKMAKQLGDESTYQSAIYRAAKTAIPMLSRFWVNEYAKENNMITPDEYVIGYFEDDGVLAISKTSDPWNMTSVLSGNGVEPEVFDLYMKYANDALQKYEDKFDEFYPHWSEGDYKYSRRLTYPDNSGYTTIPHIYSRFRLGYSMDTIMRYVEQAQKTRQMWWTAPNVLAEIADTYE